MLNDHRLGPIQPPALNAAKVGIKCRSALARRSPIDCSAEARHGFGTSNIDVVCSAIRHSHRGPERCSHTVTNRSVHLISSGGADDRHWRVKEGTSGGLDKIELDLQNMREDGFEP